MLTSDFMRQSTEDPILDEQGEPWTRVDIAGRTIKAGGNGMVCSIALGRDLECNIADDD